MTSLTFLHIPKPFLGLKTHLTVHQSTPIETSHRRHIKYLVVKDISIRVGLAMADLLLQSVEESVYLTNAQFLTLKLFCFSKDIDYIFGGATSVSICYYEFVT